MRKNTRGFVSLGVVLAMIAIIAVAGGAGWYAYQQSISENVAPVYTQALSVTPVIGTAPLTVKANFTSGPECSDAYRLSWGDGSDDAVMNYEPIPFWRSWIGCASVGLIHQLTHTYTSKGSHIVQLKKGIHLEETSTVTINVN